MPHPLGLHDKDYDDPAAKRLAQPKMQYVHGKDRSDPQMGAYGHNMCILYILIPYPLTVEEYQGGKSPLDSVTRKSGKKLIKVRYHKDMMSFLMTFCLACKQQGSI